MGCQRFFGLGLLLPAFLALVPTEAISQNRWLLRSLYSWKSLDFDFPSPSDRTSATKSGFFIEGHGVPIDVDVSNNGTNGFTVFVTIPRLQDGIPVTVGYVTNKKNAAGDPLIAPYPNWEMQTPGVNCSGFTSVYRVAIDSCKRIWILDTGVFAGAQACPPKLLAYSLETNTLLKRYVFPKEQYRDTSLFVTPIVDVRNNCFDTYVYIADVTGFSLIVYEDKWSRSWRITNKLFYPYPDYGTFTINGESFDLMDGILGMTLGPVRHNGDRILYFHSLASRVEGWVLTSVIRDYPLFRNHPEGSPRSFNVFTKPRTSQSAAQVMDRNGILFYGLITDQAIECWNSEVYREFGGENVQRIIRNDDTLQFTSGMKVIDINVNGSQSLWMMTIPFQKVMAGTLNKKEVNFRIQLGSINDLVFGTTCMSFMGNSNYHFTGSNY